MCGIAVAIDWDGADKAVRQLIAGILHRGDITDPVVLVSDRIAMCTRRLRIVDVAHGAQPQASFDERLLVSLNGEITITSTYGGAGSARRALSHRM